MQTRKAAIDLITNCWVEVTEETEHERFIQFRDGSIDERMKHEVLYRHEILRLYLRALRKGSKTKYRI